MRNSYDHFIYLGINIARHPKLIFKRNYLDLVDRLKSMMDNWKLLPLWLICRVNAIKMVVLPKFTYLFQNVPIFSYIIFFKTIDSINMSFIWAYKPPRISKAHLQKPNEEGGLRFPCLITVSITGPVTPEHGSSGVSLRLDVVRNVALTPDDLR